MSRLVLCGCVVVALWSASVISMSVFSDPPRAHMLLRSRRANSFLEELKPASMERECVEEKCDFEEAREIFQTREATLEFWTVYTDGNQCQSNMCEHGSCVDLYQAYACRCNQGYEGKYCNQLQTATNCSVDNGGCDHDCLENDDSQTRSCGCLTGYKLDNDHKQCVKKGQSSCGQLGVRTTYSPPMEGPQPWMVGGEVGKKGESPWQVLLLNARGRFHCGGVLIDESWVLTAAHCLENNLRFRVRLGDYERLRDEGTEVTLRVAKTFKHPNYNSRTVDNDIALLRLETPAPFSEYIIPVCLPSREMAERVLHLNGTITVVSGWGKEDLDSNRYSSALNVIKIPLVSHSICARQMFPHNISENVLCAGILGQRKDACEGDSGGPMVTLYRNTWFLVGLVSWGDGCGKEDKLGIYTKVSNYNHWISKVREEWDKAHHPQQPPSV
ncbi:vitamin K-dependent protein C [Acanthochromis polyacanthus]|uniref:Vitamin K-dependent protein C n=1 Tax=Acanthochromis polyacanthus TaxID=80966 RepID=A0A3Q1GDY0_9TELE|nr:vitamin K-dependent protein C [Acanthochromis polyacanthus]XP_051809140.1 vitamin K-dependent protein C [Acanthochromis polyacanthus]